MRMKHMHSLDADDNEGSQQCDCRLDGAEGDDQGAMKMYNALSARHGPRSVVLHWPRLL